MLQFNCPQCGGQQLEEVVHGASVYTPLLCIEEKGTHEYDKPVIEEGSVAHYRCMDCGYMLKDSTGALIVTDTAMKAWVKSHCRLETPDI